MPRTRSVLAAISVSVAIFTAGCGGSDGEASSDAAATSTSTTAVAPTTTTTAPATDVAGAPAEALVASSPAWTEACAVGDKLIEQAWALEAGTLTDKNAVAVSMLELIDKVPPGAADEEIAFVTGVINGFVGGDDLSPYEEDFRPQAEELLTKVAKGCGLADGASMPLPPDVVGEIADFIFA